MRSANFVVLGESGIAEGFGKKGTQTDVTLYDKKESDIIRTWIVPNGFPEKIPPLFQAISMSESAILHVSSLDRFAGEQIVALDTLGIKTGLLSHSYDVDEDTLLSMIRGTVLERYTRTTPDDMMRDMAAIEPVSRDGKARVVIDHCFDVRGVGTVILGKVVSGSIKQYDTLQLMPHEIDVVVKSIQMHDDPVSEATCPARVGLSIKGAKPDQIGRGDMLCAPDSVMTSEELHLDFAQSIYYKDAISENQMCMVSVGLQSRPGRFSSVSPAIIRLDKKIAYEKDQTCAVLRPESRGIRIMGGGRIT